MTFAAEVAKTAQDIEAWLCIEGVGWPRNEADLTAFFSGTVFATKADTGTSGALASLLSCTVAKTLYWPNSLGDRLDPRLMNYEIDSASFEVQETSADFLLTTFSGTQTPTVGSLGAELAHGSTTVRIDNSPGTFSEGDVAWVAGREAILLGAKTAVAGTIYEYTSCTRGYLGTPDGRYAPDTLSSAGPRWANATSVTKNNPYWSGRRVVLFAKALDDGLSEIVRLYTGRINGIRCRKDGTVWTIETAAISHEARRARPVMGPVHTSVVVWNAAAAAEDQVLVLIPDHGGDAANALLSSLYQYRTEPGGTAAWVTAIDTTSAISTTQAVDIGSDVDVCESHVDVNGTIISVVKKSGTGVACRRSSISPGGVFFPGGIAGKPTYATPMLDNITEDYRLSRFAMDRIVRRNPMDVALMFLTSMNHEYYVADAAGVPTSTVVDLGSPGWSTNQWAGYALHCVEGNNKGYARKIASNDPDEITTVDAFPGAASAGEEHQIRNTIYDVLPLGWGMGMHNNRIDLASAERLRDRYLIGATLGRVAILGGAIKDTWQMLNDWIFRPYGILPYIARSTGKLTFAYVGEPLGDGVAETYVSLTDGDILGAGDLNMLPSAPLAKAVLRISIGARAITEVTEWKGGNPLSVSYSLPAKPDDMEDIPAGRDPSSGVFEHTKGEVVEMEAGLNDMASAAWVLARLESMLQLYDAPPPIDDVALDIANIFDVYAGVLCKMTSSMANLPCPPTASRGWSQVVARCLGTRIVTSGGQRHIVATMQFLRDRVGCLLAPCAQVTGKTTVGGRDALNITQNAYGFEENDTSWFVVGDHLEIRGNDAAMVSDIRINLSAAPIYSIAATQIVLTGTPLGAYTWEAGDYVTIAKANAITAANLTANERRFALLGDAGVLIGAIASRQFVG